MSSGAGGADHVSTGAEQRSVGRLATRFIYEKKKDIIENLSI